MNMEGQTMKKAVTSYYLSSNHKTNPLREQLNLGLYAILLLFLISVCSCASLDSSNYKSRIRAINKTTDESVLVRIAMTDNNPEVCKAALNRISDQNLIARVARESMIWENRKLAFLKLTDQNLLFKIALEDPYPSVRNFAISKITDQKLIARIIMESKDMETRKYALARLVDQEELIRVTQECDDWGLRRTAFNSLNDASLSAIVKDGKDPAIILAAKIRLGQSSWNDAFYNNRSGNALGDVIGAAAVVDNPKPTARDVVSACHTYIRQGDASRIPELRYLLLNFGDKELAEDYLNCGNEQLADAAAEWGNAHGYRIGTGYGSHRVQWGSDKK